MSFECLSILLDTLKTYKRHISIDSSTVTNLSLVFTLGATEIEFAWVQFTNQREIVLLCSWLTISEKSNAFWTPNFTQIFLFVAWRCHSSITTFSSDSEKMREMSVRLLKFVNVLVECMTVHTSKFESLLSFYDGNMFYQTICCKRKTLSIKILSKLHNSTHHFDKILILNDGLLNIFHRWDASYSWTVIRMLRGSVSRFITGAYIWFLEYFTFKLVFIDSFFLIGRQTFHCVRLLAFETWHINSILIQNFIILIVISLRSNQILTIK